MMPVFSSPLAVWLYSVICWLAAPAPVDEARYQAVASAVADVVSDPAEAPLWPGPDGRAQTATLLLAIGWGESRLDPRAVSHRGRRTAYCSQQIELGPGELTREGYSAQDLLEDPRACFRAALHLVRLSLGACRHLGPGAGLVAYSAGTCSSERALRLSRARVALAYMLVRRKVVVE